MVAKNERNSTPVPISSLGYGASEEKRKKFMKPCSLAKISEHFVTTFSNNFSFRLKPSMAEGHALLRSNQRRHPRMMPSVGTRLFVIIWSQTVLSI